ncbi:MAG: Asp-tRNA(Asn)/Glu-tRNA(Gln) amidotransferase GatCAB subunit C [Nautilia sp.]|nr:MAG: Asp-tRNA(Asn)/Glu-tRNA(Gln) amidotransferase GatCAB subunit C [Nautilia sp.]
MKIDEKLLAKLEKLSMIKVENKEEMINDLNQIVEFVEILNEVDTDGIEATFNVLNSATPMREDIPTDSDVIKSVLEHAPKVEGNYFIVPKIIEG